MMEKQQAVIFTDQPGYTFETISNAWFTINYDVVRVGEVHGTIPDKELAEFIAHPVTPDSDTSLVVPHVLLYGGVGFVTQAQIEFLESLGISVSKIDYPPCDPQY